MRRGSTRVTFGSPLRAEPGEDARSLGQRVERAVAVLADEQVTDWWTAARRAAAGRTPTLEGPDAGAWRRNWALSGQDRDRRAARDATEWPPR